ncbi:MAG: hypothetical protein C0497_15845 [Gemmatimonas sp.]|nr:hypothetical protein [Gemmatimonas sp.]
MRTSAGKCFGSSRRAGKSWVLTRFSQSVSGIYYQATNRTETEQLAALSRIIRTHFEDAALLRGVALPDWESLFQYLTDRAAGAPLLLVLDEFPYLAAAAPALPSIIQAAWDHDWPGTRLKLVLSGSHITAMQRLEHADQPLYGRRTGRLVFSPFTHEYTGGFVPAYSARDQLIVSIFGGLPGHLALLDPQQGLAANVMRQMLTPSGRLFDEAQHMLDAFLGDADIHYSIIQAIANGDHTWSKITSRLGKRSGSISRPMRWLEEMQVVSRMVPITEASPQRSKRTLYRITDPYVAFWHRFVASLIATGEVSVQTPEQLWHARITPRLDDYMGAPFEDICRSWTGRTARLPFRPSRVGAWWDANSQNAIDVVAMGLDGDILVGECKWGSVDDADLDLLRMRATRLVADLPSGEPVRRVHYALFSGTGIWSSDVAAAIAAGDVLGFSSADLTVR